MNTQDPAMGGGDNDMLFASLWKVNIEKCSLKEASMAAAKMFEKEVYPPKGVEIIGQWVTTQGRGITIFEAEDPEAVLMEGDVIELEKTGLFKYQETFPVMNMSDHIGGMLSHKKVL